MSVDGDTILYGREQRTRVIAPAAEAKQLTLDADERLELRDAALLLKEAADEADRDGHETLAEAFRDLSDEWKGFAVSRNDPPTAEMIASSLYENVQTYVDCMDEEWGDHLEQGIIAIADRLSGAC